MQQNRIDSIPPPRLQLKLAVEHLEDLTEALAHVSHATAGDAEASKERSEILEAIAAQRRLITELQGAEIAR